jgi:transposase
MAKRYRPVLRDQPFLMPPDMREWLPGDHLAWFVIDAVELLDLSGLAVRPGGPGRAAFDPRVMLGLLFYGYATGVRSSRAIECGCRSDVAFRVICAQDVPDHSTVARFRRSHFADPDAVAGLFGQVLAIAARAGMGRLGLIGLDGTKIAASASKDASRDAARIAELAAEILAEAEEADAAEDALFGQARGDELPDELADPVTRRQRILRAAADLAAEQEAARAAAGDQARAFRERRAGGKRTGPAPKGQAGQLTSETADAIQARCQAKYDDWHARNDASLAATGKPLRGFAPVPPDQHSRVRRARARAARAAERDDAAGPRRDQPRTRANTTDPDSRLMPVRGGGFIQGHNAQAAYSADGLCIAALVTTSTTDYASYQPLITAVTATAATLQAAAPTTLHARTARPGIILADAGYLSDHNLTTPLPPGAARLIATRSRHAPDGTTAPQATSPRAQAMTETLATEPARSHYKTRSPLAEGPFGDIKHNLGFRRFHTRGLTRVTSEWTHQNTARNLLKIHAATT